MAASRKKTRVRSEQMRASDRARSAVHRATRAAPRAGLVEHTTLPVSDIETGSYQRALNEQWVEAIAKNFNPALFEPLHVALRDDNKYYVVDGQHRIAAAIKRGLRTVPVVLHLDTEEQEEAKLFVALQDRKLNLAQTARHHANVIAGDENAKHLDRILHANNFKIARYIGSGANREFSCPLALESVLKSYGEGVLSASCQVLSVAWNGHASALKAMLVKGIAIYLSEHADIISTPVQQKLAERLRALKPSDILLRAAVIRHTLGCSSPRSVAQVIGDVAATGRGIYAQRETAR